jgi:ZIP family zinc transporter
MMLLSVTLHNIPEGMAVGVVYAGLMYGNITSAGALALAAGAMIYVVVEELIPEMSEGEHSNIGVVMFAVGFTCMMALDVALG